MDTEHAPSVVFLSRQILDRIVRWAENEPYMFAAGIAQEDSNDEPV